MQKKLSIFCLRTVVKDVDNSVDKNAKDRSTKLKKMISCISKSMTINKLPRRNDIQMVPIKSVGDQCKKSPIHAQ